MNTMLFLPKLKSLKTATERQAFATQYEACSQLPIPSAYLLSANTQVFGFYYRGQIIGGFMLGDGQDFRTIALFAQPSNQTAVYQAMQERSTYTEICCLWMSHKYRKSTLVNVFNWAAMAITIYTKSKENLLFGTCSAGLARLYAASNKTSLLLTDRVQKKRTFILQGKKQESLVGIFNIIKYKLKRRYSNKTSNLSNAWKLLLRFRMVS